MRAVRYSNGASKDIRKSIAVNLPDKASFSRIKKGSNSSASIFIGKNIKLVNMPFFYALPFPNLES